MSNETLAIFAIKSLRLQRATVARRHKLKDNGQCELTRALGYVEKVFSERRKILRAVRKYHHALDTRQSGDLAAHDLRCEIQTILGRPWIQGATLKRKSK